MELTVKLQGKEYESLCHVSIRVHQPLSALDKDFG